jgi:hypothetical protein
MDVRFAGIRSDDADPGGAVRTFLDTVNLDVAFHVQAAVGETWLASVSSVVRAGLTAVKEDGGGALIGIGGIADSFQCTVRTGQLRGGYCDRDLVMPTGQINTSETEHLPYLWEDGTNVLGRGSQDVLLRFRYQLSVRSVNGGEAAIRLGIPGNLDGMTADDYPGQGPRDLREDGHFVQIRLKSSSGCRFALGSGPHFDLECLEGGGGCLSAELFTATSTVAEAAKACGFDHLNWLNLVTRDDRLEECRATNEFECPGCGCLRTQGGSFPQIWFVDPPPGGYYYLSVETGRPFPVSDSLDWYYDEGSCHPNAECYAPLSYHVSGNYLNFFDQPGTSAGRVIEFITALAGVRGGNAGDVVQVPGLKTVLRWRYIGGAGDDDEIRTEPPDEAVAGTGTFELIGLYEADELEPEIQDGLRALGFLQVPEPAAWSMHLIALVGTFWLARTQRRNRVRAADRRTQARG